MLYENLVKKHCTIEVVLPPSFMRRIVLAIFWAEYLGRSPGQKIDIQVYWKIGLLLRRPAKTKQISYDKNIPSFADAISFDSRKPKSLIVTATL